MFNERRMSRHDFYHELSYLFLFDYRLLVSKNLQNKKKRKFKKEKSDVRGAQTEKLKMYKYDIDLRRMFRAKPKISLILFSNERRFSCLKRFSLLREKRRKKHQLTCCLLLSLSNFTRTNFR